MRMGRKFIAGGLAVLALSASISAARADFLFTVSVNTSELDNDKGLTGPFGIDFQMISGGSASVNEAAISDFNFGGGSPVGAPSSLAGNVAGNLSSTVKLEVDNTGNFFSDFNQGFTPGSTLSFLVDLTTNVGTPAPDAFVFSILQGYSANGGTPIPTTDPFGTDALVSLDITSSAPPINAYSGSAGDPPLLQVNVVPEPSTLMLSLLSLASLGLAAGWGGRRRVLAAARDALAAAAGWHWLSLVAAPW